MSLSRLAIATAPVLFVLLWSTGFIGARYGLPYIEPLTFLAVRMFFVVVIMAASILAITSAFAPRYYPQDIIDFANSRGADKVMYAGYFPMGLSLDRIFREMPGVPFKDEVWPKFLRENATRVFKLDD